MPGIKKLEEKPLDVTETIIKMYDDAHKVATTAVHKCAQGGSYAELKIYLQLAVDLLDAGEQLEDLYNAPSREYDDTGDTDPDSSEV